MASNPRYDTPVYHERAFTQSSVRLLYGSCLTTQFTNMNIENGEALRKEIVRFPDASASSSKHCTGDYRPLASKFIIPKRKWRYSMKIGAEGHPGGPSSFEQPSRV